MVLRGSRATRWPVPEPSADEVGILGPPLAGLFLRCAVDSESKTFQLGRAGGEGELRARVRFTGPRARARVRGSPKNTRRARPHPFVKYSQGPNASSLRSTSVAKIAVHECCAIMSAASIPSPNFRFVCRPMTALLITTSRSSGSSTLFPEAKTASRHRASNHGTESFAAESRSRSRSPLCLDATCSSWVSNAVKWAPTRMSPKMLPRRGAGCADAASCAIDLEATHLGVGFTPAHPISCAGAVSPARAALCPGPARGLAICQRAQIAAAWSENSYATLSPRESMGTSHPSARRSWARPRL